jgi:hypothetical protein
MRSSQTMVGNLSAAAPSRRRVPRSKCRWTDSGTACRSALLRRAALHWTVSCEGANLERLSRTIEACRGQLRERCGGKAIEGVSSPPVNAREAGASDDPPTERAGERASTDGGGGTKYDHGRLQAMRSRNGAARHHRSADLPGPELDADPTPFHLSVLRVNLRPLLFPDSGRMRSPDSRVCTPPTCRPRRPTVRPMRAQRS